MSDEEKKKEISIEIGTAAEIGLSFSLSAILYGTVLLLQIHGDLYAISKALIRIADQLTK